MTDVFWRGIERRGRASDRKYTLLTVIYIWLQYGHWVQMSLYLTCKCRQGRSHHCLPCTISWTRFCSRDHQKSIHDYLWQQLLKLLPDPQRYVDNLRATSVEETSWGSAACCLKQSSSWCQYLPFFLIRVVNTCDTHSLSEILWEAQMAIGLGLAWWSARNWQDVKLAFLCQDKQRWQSAINVQKHLWKLRLSMPHLRLVWDTNQGLLASVAGSNVGRWKHVNSYRVYL